MLHNVSPVCRTEVEAAKQIELDVDFKKVILITKLLKIKEKSNKKNRAAAAATVKEVYENEEDETLAEVSAQSNLKLSLQISQK